jgi:hypothetical protein
MMSGSVFLWFRPGSAAIHNIGNHGQCADSTANRDIAMFFLTKSYDIKMLDFTANAPNYA